ncbi:hypothetical protein NLX83_20905 [Allokutzneria sp. A3M-2-11 16]|uniref:hypothetical protein n=1 Tax=Allokutzneria sp. A3M-2-11 16 TaxID=2962043 RepID=UPI0020B7D80A|nr:hypothetical protein [Allokutzneria sp. A3M-2-11 16]MCP3801726.1 hypothetical protein [Allokutzneria sp. A3M-2-11 16]
MTTAVIGTGFIGRAFANAGIPTVFGSRDPGDSPTEITVAEAGAVGHGRQLAFRTLTR